MPSMEEYAKQPAAERLKRLARTPDELAAAIHGQSETNLSRRPDAKHWAAKEVVCHLRDTEELFIGRFALVAAMDDPKFPSLNPGTPDRWAEDRQYLRNDAAAALDAFRKRREESLAYLGTLGPDGWRRGGIHPQRGRMTIDDFVTLMAWHDDNHLDQLQRALAGKA